eukprot:452485-Amphidinium_carterae.1
MSLLLTYYQAGPPEEAVVFLCQVRHLRIEMFSVRNPPAQQPGVHGAHNNSTHLSCCPCSSSYILVPPLLHH